MSQTASPLTTGRNAREIFGYGPIGTSTRERLMDVAMDLFYSHGIHAVGIDQIIREVGVTKTTFYNHFESKDELIAKVLECRSEWEQQAYTREAKKIAGDDPRGMLLALFDVINMWFNNPRFRGCQFINAAHEFPSPHDPVHQAAREHGLRTLEGLVDLAGQAGAEDPEALAHELAVLIDGAFTCRLVMLDNNAAVVARRAAELLLERHLPPRD